MKKAFAFKSILAIVSICLATICITTTQAQTTWDGSGDGTNWFDSANWDNGIPVDGDTAIISSVGSGIVLTGQTANLASFTISNNTLTFSDTTNLTAALVSTDIIINSGGILTHNPNTDTSAPWLPNNRVYIECTDLTINSGGEINVNEKGYTHDSVSLASIGTGFGPGGGMNGGNSYRSGGAGYGGIGGNGDTAPPNGLGGVSYGSLFAPTDPGSGGGNAGATAPFTGGDGGGIAKISATGQVTVNGLISANGSKPVKGGGGSGGSIYITCNTFAATDGNIHADAGAPGRPDRQGGSGGGRIAIVYNSVVGTPTVTFSSAQSEVTYSGYQVARPGTLYLSDNTFYPTSSTFVNSYKLYIPGFTSWSPSSITVDDCDVTLLTVTTLTTTGDVLVKSGGALELSPNIQCSIGGNLILTNNSDFWVQSSQTGEVSVLGDINVYDSSSIQLSSHATNGGYCAISTEGNFTLETDGIIEASGGGYSGGISGSSGFGPNGPGQPGGGSYVIYRSGGGGYGGHGGGGAISTATGGQVYGYSNAPAYPGSGSGSRSSTDDGKNPGGGLIDIEVAGTATIDGTITSDGADADHGGGSGGGIFIRCEQFMGSGSLNANGGNGNSSKGGAGGGGRIAVWHGVPVDYYDQILATNLHHAVISSTSAIFTGTTSVAAGTIGNTTIESAEDGTVIFLTVDNLLDQGTVIMIK
jgi:hypothetical protein